MPQYSKTTWVDGSAPAISAANLNKLEQGVFDAIRQDGSTTMSAQLVTIAGTAATPAIAPTGDSNTGIFFPAADTIAFGEGGTEAMRINSSGNVGIGTQSPSTKLDASGSIKATLTSESTSLGNINSGLIVQRSANDSQAFFDYRSTPDAWVIGATYSSTGTYKPIAFATSDNERMRITSAGNVGIGTTSPTAYTGYTTLELDGATNGGILSIKKAGSIVGYLNGSSGLLLISQTGNLVMKTSGADALVFGTNATDRMWLTSSGNFGIGTASPTVKLDVTAGTTANTVTSFFTQGNADGGFKLGFANGSGSTANSEQGALVFNYTTTRIGSIGFHSGGSANCGAITFSTSIDNERMRIDSAGNVGIGTTSPSAELHVKGASEILRLETTTARGSGSNWIQFNDPTGNSALLGFANVANWFYVSNELNERIIFRTNSTERMIIEAGGTTRPATNNTYDLGSATYRWATIYAQNALNTSDARLKTDVAPSSLGLDFIASLNPVQYRWIEGGNTVDKVQTGTETVEISPAIPAQPEVLDEEGNVIQEATQEVPAVTEERPVFETVVTPREGVRTHFGLIAQEVKAALPDGLDFAGWCLADKDDADSTQSLGYTQLIAPMIKAIQELNAKVEALEAQLAK